MTPVHLPHQCGLHLELVFVENVRIGAALCYLGALLGVIWSSAVSLKSKHSQQHGKLTQGVFCFCLFLCVFCFVFQEEVKAFQNSSEKQKSLMSSWCWVLFSLPYKISMSNALMKIIHCPNYPDLQEEQKHLYRKTFLYNLPRKMYHVSGLVWMKSQVFKNFQNRFTSPPTSFVLII